MGLLIEICPFLVFYFLRSPDQIWSYTCLELETSGFYHNLELQHIGATRILSYREVYGLTDGWSYSFVELHIYGT